MRRSVAALLLLLAAPLASHAQTVNSGVGIGPSQQLSEPTAPPTPQVEHLLGGLGGLRPTLEAHEITILLDAISEFAGNVSGGTTQGSTFANQIGLEADIDWQKLAGLQGLSTHVIMVNRSGSSDSQLFGDNLLPVQEIYGAGGGVAIHLVSAYAQLTLSGGAFDIAAGRMNVENDFAASPLYCNYMNNALCGDPKALPGGDIGHSAYPDAVWAARIRVRPVPSIYLESGVYEGNQDLYTNQFFRSGFKFDTSPDSGVYLPVELGWEPKIAGLPGHYKVGVGIDTSHFKSFPSLNGTTSRHPNTQFWVLADQMLIRHGEGDQSGLIALGG